MSYLFFKNSIRGKDIDIENSSTKILTKTSFIFPTSSNRVCVLKVFWDNILQCSNCLTLIWGGGGGKFNPPTQIQGCFIIFAVRLLAEALQKLYIPSQITIIFVIAFYIMRHLCYPENKQNQELKMPDVLK